MMSYESTDEIADAVEVSHSPATISSVVAVAAGLMAVLASGLFSILALGLGLFGLAGIAAGLFVVESKRAVDAGSAIVFLAVIVSGIYGNTAPFLLLGALGTILAFDMGNNAFSVGGQLSEQTRTQRGELAHVAASVAFGAIAAGLAYAVYLVGAGGQSVAVLAGLLLGALLLVWAIHE